jgi:SAM-dependent methyltransferase
MVPVSARNSGDTTTFYHDLIHGRVSRGIWGKEKRFSPGAIVGKQSVEKYFTRVVRRYIKTTDRVLDLGCGPGGFLSIIARFCARVVGVDITSGFIDECTSFIGQQGLRNASALLVGPGTLPFRDGSFDAVLMIDTIHHLEHPAATIDDTLRLLKKDGTLLIFEPNLLNPLLFLMCCFDGNERGLLRFGTKRAYRSLLGDRFEIGVENYNGLLIGPESRLSLVLADMLNAPAAAGAVGWLNPKLFIAARKR